jgi:alanine racemase
MRIAVVACGYADGYPRHAPSGTPVYVEGKKTSTVGRVSMDMLYIDVTDIPHASISSDVELWGENIPVDDVAEKAGTVGYELLCAMSASKRVPIEIIHG